MPKAQAVIAQWPTVAATPAGNPPVGSVLIYYKSTDGLLYTKSSAGVETVVASPNDVTLDTDQTITGAKRFSSATVPHPPIISSPTASPPPSPQTGDLWIVPDGAGSQSPPNFAIGPTDPGLTQGMWVQTGLGSSGQDFTIWIETGV